MGLADTIRGAVATADKITKSLQANVTHRPWINSDEMGEAIYASPKTYKALVDLKQQERKTASGKIVMVRATVTILQPIKPNGAAKRVEPVDPRDLITLPDGTSGPIVDIVGFVDSKTTHPFFSEIYLG